MKMKSPERAKKQKQKTKTRCIYTSASFLFRRHYEPAATNLDERVGGMYRLPAFLRCEDVFRELT